MTLRSLIPDERDVLELRQHVDGSPHRILNPTDLNIIFQDAGGWWLFYSLLICSGMRIHDCAQLIHSEIDRERSIIGTRSAGSNRYYELPVLPPLLDHIPPERLLEKPVFPSLYVDFEDPVIWEDMLNENLAQPSDYLKALLSVQERPVASLVAFRMTFDEVVRPLLPDYPSAIKWFNQTCQPNNYMKVVS